MLYVFRVRLVVIQNERVGRRRCARRSWTFYSVQYAIRNGTRRQGRGRQRGTAFKSGTSACKSSRVVVSFAFLSTSTDTADKRLSAVRDDSNDRMSNPSHVRHENHFGLLREVSFPVASTRTAEMLPPEPVET